MYWIGAWADEYSPTLHNSPLKPPRRILKLCLRACGSHSYKFTLVVSCYAKEYFGRAALSNKNILEPLSSYVCRVRACETSCTSSAFRNRLWRDGAIDNRIMCDAAAGHTAAADRTMNSTECANKLERSVCDEGEDEDGRNSIQRESKDANANPHAVQHIIEVFSSCATAAGAGESGADGSLAVRVGAVPLVSATDGGVWSEKVARDAIACLVDQAGFSPARHYFYQFCDAASGKPLVDGDDVTCGSTAQTNCVRATVRLSLDGLRAAMEQPISREKQSLIAACPQHDPNGEANAQWLRCEVGCALLNPFFVPASCPRLHLCGSWLQATRVCVCVVVCVMQRPIVLVRIVSLQVPRGVDYRQPDGGNLQHQSLQLSHQATRRLSLEHVSWKRRHALGKRARRRLRGVVCMLSNRTLDVWYARAGPGTYCLTRTITIAIAITRFANGEE